MENEMEDLYRQNCRNQFILLILHARINGRNGTFQTKKRVSVRVERILHIRMQGAFGHALMKPSCTVQQ